MKIEIQGVNKRFGSQPVLRDVTLSTDFPRALALIGPSGGGKSTLLRVLAGLLAPDSGRVSVDGVPVPESENELRRYRKSVGVVFQAYNLFPHLSALENVVLPLVHVHGCTREEATARAMEELERFHLAGHAEKRPGALSGGQRQRVAIARALATRPRVLFFDEPTSALDPEMTGEVLDVLAGLKEMDRHFVVVTHEMGFARRVADQVAFLAGGQILECRPAGPFFDSPESPEAVRFLERLLKY